MTCYRLHRFYVLGIIFGTISVNLSAQTNVFSIHMLNLDHTSGPLSATITVDGNSTSTPPVPYGGTGNSDNIGSDVTGNADGVIKDSLGRTHSTFSSWPHGAYLIALPGRNLSLHHSMGRGFVNATSERRTVTIAELNGPVLNETVKSWSMEAYPDQWPTGLVAGLSFGNEEWWVVRRASTYEFFDFFLHQPGDSLVVGTLNGLQGETVTRVDKGSDSARIRFVNTSISRDVIVEVVDEWTDTVEALVASRGRAVDGAQNRVRVWRSGEVLVDTMVTTRPYGYYDLVLLQSSSSKSRLRIDERLCDGMVARVLPHVTPAPDGSAPYWDSQYRVVAGPAGEMGGTSFRMLDSQMVPGRTHRILDVPASYHLPSSSYDHYSAQYLEVLDNNEARIARYRIASSSSSNMTFIVTDVDGELIVFEYDEFALDDQSLIRSAPQSQEDLPVSVDVWNFVSNSDSIVLSLPALAIRDTLQTRYTSGILTYEATTGSGYEVASIDGGTSVEGIFNGPRGGSAVILADDDPAGGIRTVVAEIPDGRTYGRMSVVNFTEGVGTLYISRTSGASTETTDSVPEGTSLSLLIESDTILISTTRDEAIGRTWGDVDDEDVTWIIDGSRAVGELWRYVLSGPTYGPRVISGARIELAGIGDVPSTAWSHANFSLRPIPARESLIMECNGIPQRSGVRLRAVDLLGRTALEWNVELGPSGSGALHVDCSGLPTGVYNFVLTGGNYSSGSILVPIQGE